ncbi:glycosyltransferase family A protein [Salinivibrio sp. KP-1]|uniref:glycosyltransferase family A protein n=1 Tax=Salinivibrio sp. KP-1 TaxID=1406902 RepID=UPI000614862E|nr:glycosyltransferase family A protein [Salinivibrio sp. KP-1]KKA44120.1 hypothetical protein WN56_12955 [Salinivibrio sp. KP-1]
MRCTFSVVITTKNRPDFLFRCVHSIYRNSVLPEEVIIINDGGDRLTDDVFNSYNIKIKTVNNKISKGANFCRNYGVSLAKTELVFFIDDDDTFTKYSFERRLEVFSSDSEIGLVYTGFNTVFSDDLNTVVSSKVPVEYSDNYTHDLLSKGNIIGSTSRVAVRVAEFNKTDGFDNQLSSMQDYDMWIRMSQVTKIKHDCHIGINYTIHSGTSNQVSKNYNKYLQASEYLINKYKYLGIQNKCLREFRANLYLRVAIAGADSFGIKSLYSLMSLKESFSLKALGLLVMPTTFLRSFKSFV